MAFVITNGTQYCKSHAGKALVTNVNKAYHWADEAKANNQLANIKLPGFRVECIESSTKAKLLVEPKMSVDLFDAIHDLSIFVADIPERKRWLKQKIREKELEILDIEHAAEFQKLNVCEGYKIYKRLHDVRNERRQCKDEYAILENLTNISLTPEGIATLKEFIANMDKRTYHPRKLDELFEED